MLVRGQRRGLEDWLAEGHVPIRDPTRLGGSARLRAYTPVSTCLGHSQGEPGGSSEGGDLTHEDASPKASVPVSFLKNYAVILKAA